MSIEFGILREGSILTLIGDYRVALSDDVFFTIEPLFTRIGALTGQEIDIYGGAEFDEKALPIFIKEIEVELRRQELSSEEIRKVLMELLRVARHACSCRKTLSYFGD